MRKLERSSHAIPDGASRDLLLKVSTPLDGLVSGRTMEQPFFRLLRRLPDHDGSTMPEKRMKLGTEGTNKFSTPGVGSEELFEGKERFGNVMRMALSHREL
jgi:hypothetical protein